MHARLLTAADAGAFCRLRRRALTESPWAFFSSPADDHGADPRVIAERLAGPEYVIAGVEADRSAGPAELLAVAGIRREPRAKTRHRADVWGVYCEPAARGRGLGRAVMTLVIDTARRWPGVEVVTLCVSSNGHAAIRLYESLGFRPWGTEPDALRVGADSFDNIHLQLRL